ncbi:MAG TPA: 2-dehydropantoate 2-reductase [Alphaproteobacteria bacterium]|nr:2-dehydropantoate 2-reductase [Alphaproteobacteria bacterium]
MKIAIVGAGSIGGFLGARLAFAGEDVTFVARGATLAAIRCDGFALIEEDGSRRVAKGVEAIAIHEGTPQDLVLLALKAHQVPAIAADLGALFGPDTSVVTLQNGIPWWYFYKQGGPFEGRPVRAADPDGIIAAHIADERIIGSVVYPACELIAPGVVRVIEGNRFSLGEPDGSRSGRVQRLADALTRAGFKAPIATDLRSEIWLKLWGNIVFNPVSALTHATLAGICGHPPSRALAAAMMAEIQAVAEKLGVRLRVSIEKRIAGAAAVGEHKTSMLQDVEAGRPLELDALVGSVVEMARLTGTPTPSIDAVYAVAGLLGKTLSDRHGRLEIAST